MSVVTNLVFYLLVIAAGISVAVQQILNANLRDAIGSPWWAGFASYLLGTIVMLTMALIVKGPRLSDIPLSRTTLMSWTGGIFGAVFIGTVILMIPRLGVATVLALVVVGQMAAGVVIDHFGLFGAPHHLVSCTRLVGVVLLVASVILIRR